VKKIIVALLVVSLAVVALSSIALAGNGAPSGPHYNLNIIGVPKDKNPPMDNNKGHRIFVPLWGKTKILLCESGVGEDCADVVDFQVLDANGTDGEAAFALPNPDPENTGTTLYSVWARALGKPGGGADITTCAWDPVAEEEVCSMYILELRRTHGKQSFQNVSKYLLYIYAMIYNPKTEAYECTRLPLFDERLEDYLWDYDNNGLRIAQLRFYPGVQTTVPEAVCP